MPDGANIARPRVTEAGIYELLPDEYHADPCPEPSLSSTIAKTLLMQTPLHAWHISPRLNPAWEPINRKAFDIGRAAHRQVLGKGGEWVEIPAALLAKNGAANTKEAKEFIENARAQGSVPIKADEAAAVRAIAARISDRLGAMGISLDESRSEMSAVAQIDGVWCRCMVDNAPRSPRAPLYDLKTTIDASPDRIARAVMNYGYDVQAQHYREVWRAATGEDRAFRFIFVEKEEPHEICVVELTADDLMMAERRTRRAREIFRDCLTAANWPGYPLQVVQVRLPEFYQARWLEREGAEADYFNQTGADIINAARIAA